MNMVRNFSPPQSTARKQTPYDATAVLCPAADRRPSTFFHDQSSKLALEFSIQPAPPTVTSSSNPDAAAAPATAPIEIHQLLEEIDRVQERINQEIYGVQERINQQIYRVQEGINRVQEGMNQLMDPVQEQMDRALLLLQELKRPSDPRLPSPPLLTPDEVAAPATAGDSPKPERVT
ncbi:uncharacterized protein LOC127252757 [Andrographis paniculata]|uniref:uncharacterized protein LOC127252757 n=1 Tax=Andrographis paniculata TaxID=175694 RepID=UPI0021E95171|nr:uncharacterized protein LOC127252757 [Andrographis paniculata]